MLHKIRKAMGDRNRYQLTGIVEIDNAFFEHPVKVGSVDVEQTKPWLTLPNVMRKKNRPLAGMPTLPITL